MEGFASALKNLGVERGDIISIIAPNSPSIFEAHFAVPGCQAVLHCINTRLDATTIAYQLSHCQSKVLLVDSEFHSLIFDVKNVIEKNHPLFSMPIVISVQDPVYSESLSVSSFSSSSTLDYIAEYESFISAGDKNFTLMDCQDEFDAITLNYTSGTTGIN